MKFTILVHPSLVIITIYLFCPIYAWENKIRVLQIKQLYTFYPKITSLWVGGY